MKIVSYLNVSNPDALQADSGFIFQKLLLEELKARGHRVLLVAPAEAAALTTVTVLPMAPPATKYHARFACDWEALNAVMQEHWADTDALLVNQPELAATLKAMSYVEGNREIPTATYVHYLPLLNSPEQPAIVDPSLDDGGLGQWSLGLLRTAVERSDVCIVGSEFGRRLIQAHVGRAKRIEVIPPPTDSTLRDLAESRPPGDILRLLYNQRLYDHYGTMQLFSELDRLSDEGVPFEVVVTAPTQWRSAPRRALAPDADLLQQALRERPYVRITSALDRGAYRDIMSGIHVGLAPFRQAPLWSMAMVDVLTAGRLVFAPRTGGYAEVMGVCSAGLWDSPDELRRLVKGAAENPPEPRQKLADAAVQLWSASEIARRFESTFTSIGAGGAR